MQGVDLAQFQFDYDLTWAALFLNSDGTVYARYGARGQEGPMEMNSVAGLRATLRKVLEIHRGYPQTKDLLRDKRGPKPRFERPEGGSQPQQELHPLSHGARGPVSCGGERRHLQTEGLLSLPAAGQRRSDPRQDGRHQDRGGAQG